MEQSVNSKLIVSSRLHDILVVQGDYEGTEHFMEQSVNSKLIVSSRLHGMYKVITKARSISWNNLFNSKLIISRRLHDILVVWGDYEHCMEQSVNSKLIVSSWLHDMYKMITKTQCISWNSVNSKLQTVLHFKNIVSLHVTSWLKKN